jgi:hypothetical protein
MNDVDTLIPQIAEATNRYLAELTSAQAENAFGRFVRLRTH